MPTQLNLIDLPEEAKELNMQERFELFHKLNPRVYKELVMMARQLRRNGVKKAGIKMLWEVLRWDFYLTTNDPNSKFKMNNNFHSRYARLIMEKEKRLNGFFRTRGLRS